jgi:hypothetical protein
MMPTELELSFTICRIPYIHPEQGTRRTGSTARHIPELDRAIPTPTREKALVRAESEGKHNVSVGLEEVM